MKQSAGFAFLFLSLLLFLLYTFQGLSVPSRSSPAAAAQEVSTDGYPTGYDTILRPQIHFSVYRHWLNDPNGLYIDRDHVWHMYYQCWCSQLSSPPPLPPSPLRHVRT